MLPLIGELSYNGVEFGPHSRVKISCDYVKDPSGRTTKEHRIVLEVVSTFAQINDLGMAELKHKLGTPQCELIYTDNSFPIIVNAADSRSVIDLDFGPKPEIINWEPLGGGTSARVTWRVTTVVPPCGIIVASSIAFRVFDYEVAWQNPPSGYSSRTITGRFQIPLVLGGRDGRKLSQTADSFREAALSRFSPILGFERSSNFTLTNDKSTLLFTITDKQIESENSYPANVINMSVSHQIAWRRAQSGRVISRIAGSVTVAPGFGPDWALAAFVDVVEHRLNRIEAAKKTHPIIETIEVDEQLFGKTHSFAINYYLVGDPNTVNNVRNVFLDLAGFATPINADWRPWLLSMQDKGVVRGPQGLRGSAGMIWSGDHVTDVCDAAPLSPLSLPEIARLPGAAGSRSTYIEPKCPPKDRSWAEYSHSWEKLGDGYTATRVRELRDSQFSAKAAGLEPGAVATTENAGENVRVGGRKQVRDPLTFLTEADVLWVLRGHGRRVCYEIPRLPFEIKLRSDPKNVMKLIGGRVIRKVRYLPTGLKEHSASFAAIYVSNQDFEEFPPPHSWP